MNGLRVLVFDGYIIRGCVVATCEGQLLPITVRETGTRLFSVSLHTEPGTDIHKKMVEMTDIYRLIDSTWRNALRGTQEAVKRLSDAEWTALKEAALAGPEGWQPQ